MYQAGEFSKNMFILSLTKIGRLVTWLWIWYWCL